LIWKEFFEKGATKKAIILEKLIKGNKIAIYDYSLIRILKDLNDKETSEKILKGFLCFTLCRDRKRRLDKSK